MPYLLVRHRVEDFAKWKSVFTEHSAARKAGGSRGGLLLHDADDPNNLVLLFEWDSLARARAFADSDDLRRAMQRADVTDQPDIYFLGEAERIPE